MFSYTIIFFTRLFKSIGNTILNKWFRFAICFLLFFVCLIFYIRIMRTPEFNEEVSISYLGHIDPRDAGYKVDLISAIPRYGKDLNIEVDFYIDTLRNHANVAVIPLFHVSHPSDNYQDKYHIDSIQWCYVNLDLDSEVVQMPGITKELIDGQNINHILDELYSNNFDLQGLIKITNNVSHNFRVDYSTSTPHNCWVDSLDFNFKNKLYIIHGHYHLTQEEWMTPTRILSGSDTILAYRNLFHNPDETIDNYCSSTRIHFPGFWGSYRNKKNVIYDQYYGVTPVGTWFGYTRMLQSFHITKPFWSSVDCSQEAIRYKITMDSIMAQHTAINSIQIPFDFFPEFTHINPYPDSIGDRVVIYTNQDKITHIQTRGLTAFIKYPGLQNTQTARIFILTAFLTFFFTQIISALLNIIRDGTIKKKRLLIDGCHVNISVCVDCPLRKSCPHFNRK